MLENAALYRVPVRTASRLHGAPPHFCHVRAFLNTRLPNHWIGRGGHIPWPTCSQDFNLLDFLFWGFVNDIFYYEKVQNV